MTMNEVYMAAGRVWREYGYCAEQFELILSRNPVNIESGNPIYILFDLLQGLEIGAAGIIKVILRAKELNANDPLTN